MMTRSSGDRRTALSRRLKELRLEQWPARRVKQAVLAKAIGVSAPAVSSWENGEKVPPLDRLADYAAFFATDRTLDYSPARLLPDRSLTEDERMRRQALLRELSDLRRAATRPPAAAGGMSTGLWHFPDGGDVTIVCAKLPNWLTDPMEYADPVSPDFGELYRYSDPDALIELFGHIRAVNPTSTVVFRTADRLSADHFKNHLVVLGGLDWNEITRDALDRFDLPVRQLRREGDEVGGFEVDEGGRRREFLAKLESIEDRPVLVQDVSHFFRAVSPYDKERTITFCNGVYGRGVLGAVRALTDINVRAKNEQWVSENLGDTDTFSILAAVIIAKGNVVVTPDWTAAACRLHVWDRWAQL
jgi:transcriptional regulator with XRE-family HTH domain